MSLPLIPQSVDALDATQWETFRPYFDALLAAPVDAANVRDWLQAWSDLIRLIREAGAQIYIDKSLDTADSAREQAFLNFVTNVRPPAKIADQRLRERFLALDTEGPDLAPLLHDLALTLRDMRNEADLFREANVPLQMELEKLVNEYDKLTGGMQAEWDGEKKNLSQLRVLLREKDRGARARAWRVMHDLWLDARAELNALYIQMLGLRRQIAANAGLPDFRAYAFREHGRFDYTPDDCFTFHDAIEAVVAPAAARIYAQKRERLGLETLRPWDLDVDLSAAPPLAPYRKQAELVEGTQAMFQQLDPALGGYLATMAAESLLDLDTRAGKALGGYCATLPLRKRPFIFMNGAGVHDDVQTMLHEAGHAFHVFETAALPFIWQTDPPMEFAEVASMSMELLAAPYLTQARGGFYTPAEAARARIEHLEGILLFLPYMAVVDAFQHWVYTHPAQAADAGQCDAAWDGLWSRFMPGVDWTELDAERVTGWHRKLHIFHMPFYYIEYGMAQVGALQVWRNALDDPRQALADYRRALSLGGTRTLPDLFAAAGAEFRFDAALLADLVNLIEETLQELHRAES